MTLIANVFFNNVRARCLQTYTTLTSSASLRQKAYSSAVCSFHILATFLLWGSSIHLAGKGLHSVGELSNLGPLCSAGKAVETEGRYLFLTGGVPLYGAFWALPKKFPNLIHRVILLAERIYTSIVQHVILPAWRHVVVPLVRVLHSALTMLWKEVLVPIGRLFSEFARFITENVLSPLWERLIVPAARFLFDTFRTIITEVGRVFFNLASWITENVLSPLWHRLIVPVANVLSDALITLISEVGKAAKAVWNHLLLPILRWTVVPLFNALQRVITEIARASMWAGRNVLTPLYTQLIVPIASTAGAAFVAIQRTAQEVFHFFAHARP